MLVLLFLLLSLSNGDSIRSGATSSFSGATARTIWSYDARASMAIDGDPSSGHHSGVDIKPEWLNLTLARHHSRVDKVVCEIGM